MNKKKGKPDYFGPKLSKTDVLVLMIDDAEDRKRKIHAFITDKTNSFEDRKEVFLATPEHLRTHEPWIMHIDALENNGIEWYDDLYVERYSDFDLVGFVQEIDERISDKKLTEDQKRKVVEEILDYGAHSFTMDW